MALNSNNTLQIILNGYSFETHSGKAHFLIYSTTMPNDIVIDSKYFEQIQGINLNNDYFNDFNLEQLSLLKQKEKLASLSDASMLFINRARNNHKTVFLVGTMGFDWLNIEEICQKSQLFVAQHSKTTIVLLIDAKSFYTLFTDDSLKLVDMKHVEVLKKHTISVKK
ncbi:MAG: hypothetical protein JNM36_05420 [Chitinophagales bacterium]|jgi:hypothetical protein|nr:hypothetical protein [Chitinophagales bacterium]